MKSAITLPYYNNARGWVADLESFKVENTFLELAADIVISENAVELACKQMELKYLITNLNNEYREVKKELSLLLDQ
jgi:hypothetical protein